MSLTSDLKLFCKDAGADIVGVADLDLVKGKLEVIPDDLLTPFRYAVSIGIRLEDSVINTITDMPTEQYANHCREINEMLNRISSDVKSWIEKKGCSAAAIPASLKVDDDNLLGNISHKAIARLAGLGWQGKSLLLINPHFGPRVRLTTVLTDMPLEPDTSIKNLCGKCTECAKACPASAIKNTPTDTYYKDREEAIHLKKCHDKLLEFQEIPEIGYTFCGVCIKVCPFGKKTSLE